MSRPSARAGGAVNQAVQEGRPPPSPKGIIDEDEAGVVCMPEFTSVDIDGKERTAIRLVIEPR